MAFIVYGVMVFYSKRYGVLYVKMVLYDIMVWEILSEWCMVDGV